jgi:hypothetical protein
MAPRERDIFSAPFNVGDMVSVNCIVTAADGQGAGGRVTLQVSNPGNVGEAGGVTFQVSPVQCRRARGLVQDGGANV